MKKIILASSSPRRREILERTGLEFEVDAGDYDEKLDPDLPPHRLAKLLSREKAKAVAARHDNALIIAADTFIVFKGRLLGKPRSAAEATRTLTLLNGKAHSVITGFALLDTGTGRLLTGSVESRVFLKKMSSGQIRSYVRTGEPLDKAGAYAIQGLGAVLVRKIEGDYYNVVGLPLSALTEVLKKFGIRVL